MASAYSNTSNAFIICEDRIAAFHRGPAIRPGRKSKAERMRDVERLTLRALRGRWTTI